MMMILIIYIFKLFTKFFWQEIMQVERSALNWVDKKFMTSVYLLKIPVVNLKWEEIEGVKINPPLDFMQLISFEF